VAVLLGLLTLCQVPVAQAQGSAGGNSNGAAIKLRQPEGSINRQTPGISASYPDLGSPVRTGSVVMKLDGADVSSRAAVTGTGISYIPPAALAQGIHKVTLSVTDRAGKVAAAGWEFLVDTLPPQVTAVLPANGTTATDARQTVTVAYADAGSGVDPARTTLTVDGTVVTDGLETANHGLRYRPVKDWAAGSHSLSLIVSDLAGNATWFTWSVNVGAAPVIYDETPSNLTTGSQSPRVRVLLRSPSGEIDLARTAILVDGTDVSSQAKITDRQITWVPPAPIAEGSHTIRVETANQQGLRASKEWQFTIALPPVSRKADAVAAGTTDSRPAQHPVPTIRVIR